MAELKRHLDYLLEAWEAAQAAPLSARKLLLVVMLADAYADRLFGADGEADDILDYRSALAARSAALRRVFEVAAGTSRLVTEAVTVPLSAYGSLSTADFMVSLYNDHSVQRVLITLPDGARLMAHEVVGEAIGFLRTA